MTNYTGSCGMCKRVVGTMPEPDRLEAPSGRPGRTKTAKPHGPVAGMAVPRYIPSLTVGPLS